MEYATILDNMLAEYEKAMQQGPPATPETQEQFLVAISHLEGKLQEIEDAEKYLARFGSCPPREVYAQQVNALEKTHQKFRKELIKAYNKQ